MSMHGTDGEHAPGLRALIWSDLQFWADLYRGRPLAGLRGLLIAVHLLLSYSGLRATSLQRISYAAHTRMIPLVPTLLANVNVTLHGFDMSPSVPVGSRWHVPHPVGTVIAARALGANVTLVSGITIGMRKGQEFPLLGDDVYVGAGARILGGITIGDRVQIGANAVVLHNVPADSVAVGVPATVCPAREAGQPTR